MLLTEQGKIGQLTLKNRMILPAMGLRTVETTGSPSELMMRFIERRAAGGASLVTATYAYGSVGDEKDRKRGLLLDRDEYIEGWKVLADRVHALDSKIAIQLSCTFPKDMENNTALPTIYSFNPDGEYVNTVDSVPMTVSVASIRRTVRQIGESVRRARRAGYDLVEFRWCHGDPVMQFLSSVNNQRTDEYGGSLENRARICIEIIKEAKQVAGKDYPLTCRISMDEFLDGPFSGLTFTEVRQLCRWFEEAGLDGISCSAGGKSTYWKVVPTLTEPLANLSMYSETLRKELNIPIIVSGRIRTVSQAETVLKREQADFVGLGRTLIADADFPNKVTSNSKVKINACINCNTCHDTEPRVSFGFDTTASTANATLRREPHLVCAVNPAVIDDEEEIPTAATKRLIVIVGAEPSTMEFGRIALMQGHDVVWYTGPSNMLGGRWTWYASTFHVNWWSMMRSLGGIQVKCDTWPSVEEIRAHSPDIVVTHREFKPVHHDVHGLSSQQMWDTFHLIVERQIPKGNYVIYGSDATAIRLADRISRTSGTTITLLHKPNVLLGDGMDRLTRQAWVRKLYNKDVDVMQIHNLMGWAHGELYYQQTHGIVRSVPCDYFVGTNPYVESTTHIDVAALREFTKVEVFDECVQPRMIVNAMYYGRKKALELEEWNHVYSHQS